MATKDFSSKQENMIADYLGWSVVAGSGAAACFPGDIISDDWLGECKTHVERGQKIFFSKSVWRKICDEAAVKRRFPALFVDDGSQKSDRTWCLFNQNRLNLDECICFTIPVRKATNITFDHSEMLAIYEDYKSKTDLVPVFSYVWDKDVVAIAPLSVFHELINS